MKAEAFLACWVYVSAMMVTFTLKVSPPPEPVPAVPSSPLDATVPKPPEPASDCGSWSDDEECET